MRLHKDYGNPTLYVTENEVAFEDNVTKEGSVQDDDRIVFLRDHLISVYRAIKNGATVKGYSVWLSCLPLVFSIYYDVAL